MGYIFFGLVAVFCAVKWIKWRISTYSVLYYMATQNYTPPSEQEIKVCTDEVVKIMFNVKPRTGL